MTLKGSSVAGFVNDRLRSFLEGRLSVLSGCILATVGLFFLLLIHLFVGAELEYSEYFYSFYPAGMLVSMGRAGELYPAPGDWSFAHTEFNRFVHGMLAHIPASSRPSFLYPPLVACLFSLLTFLPIKSSLLAWQAINVGALALSCYLFCLARPVLRRPAHIFFLSFLPLTTMAVLVLGQLAIVFGVLPLAAGYYLWHRGRYRLCGLAWALVSVKPQLFVPLLLVVGCWYLSAACSGAQTEERKTVGAVAFGIAAGLLLFHGAPLILVGSQALPGWIRAMRMVITTLEDPTSTWAFQLVASLPALLQFCLPLPWRQAGAVLAWLVSTACLLAQALVLIAITGSRSASASEKLDVMLYVSYLSLPLISQYVRLYDYAILLVPLWIALFARQPSDRLGQALCWSALWFVLAVNAYLLILFALSRHEAVIAQVLLVAAQVACWMQAAWAAVTRWRGAARPGPAGPSAV